MKRLTTQNVLYVKRTTLFHSQQQIMEREKLTKQLKKGNILYQSVYHRYIAIAFTM